MAASASTDLPQYLGELFLKAERPNALLRLVGGLTGQIRTVSDTVFAMGVDYSLTNGSQPAILEGATPTSAQVSTTQSSNVVQIFQEAVELTYSRQGASASIDGVATIPGAPAGGAQLNRPGQLPWQIARAIEQISYDANYTMLRGAYVLPSDNLSARKSRGVRTAVSTNEFANSGTPRALTKTIFENALRDSMENGMFMMGDEVSCFGDKTQTEALINLYESATQLPISREVVGVSVRTIITKWATVNVVYEPDMAAGELFLGRPELYRVVNMPIPGKGSLFAEPLSKAGSTDKQQVYGEFGLDYVNEIFGAVIDDLST
jgi:hypothetical protein